MQTVCFVQDQDMKGKGKSKGDTTHKGGKDEEKNRK
jgi:hypothetical protein